MDGKIQMVDLRGQYLRIKGEIDKALLTAVAEAAYINGPQVKAFVESLKSFNQVKHAVTCANGTDALQIAMMALAFKPGDEVIVPAFTYIAAVEAIALLGLVPKFIDVRPETFELDYEQLESKITHKTVGIVPVHLFGQCSNITAINAIASKHGLAVIEDTAQAMGAEYIFNDGHKQFAGTVGNIGTTSFFPSKNLGCFGDGGALFTNDEVLAQRIHMIANHGQRQKYHHESVGVNSRLDTVQAAILDVKIKYLNEYAEARQAVARKYDAQLMNLNGIAIPARATYSTHVFNQYTCKIAEGKRDELRAFLQKKGVPSMIYYPKPIHLQQAYLAYGYQKGNFPVSEQLCKDVISIPIHTEMKIETQNYIIEQIKAFFSHGNG